MQRQHRVVLSLRVPIAGGQCERVIARLNAFGTCDCGIAMFIEYEDVQQRSLRNVRLPSDVRELVFDIGIGDAYGGPVVKELLEGACWATVSNVAITSLLSASLLNLRMDRRSRSVSIVVLWISSVIPPLSRDFMDDAIDIRLSNNAHR